jgi:hypothetical protein
MPTRKSAALNRKRINKEPAFERTRENMAEFGRAGAANRLLRSAFREALFNTADRYVSGRLTKRMLRIIHSDPVRSRGSRIITAEALPMLEGFNFNHYMRLQDVLYAPYLISFDRTAGQLVIDIPFFNPATMIDTASGAAGFSLIGSVTAIDFIKEEAVPVYAQTKPFASDSIGKEPVHLTLSVPATGLHPVVVCLGVEFYGATASGKQTLYEKAFNTMAVVKVFITHG